MCCFVDGFQPVMNFIDTSHAGVCPKVFCVVFTVRVDIHCGVDEGNHLLIYEYNFRLST